jgi:hypothetical protein
MHNFSALVPNFDKLWRWPAVFRHVCIAALCLLAFTTLHADELQDLSSADVAPTVDVKDVASAPKANLGEGTGSFAGALMTSGSFTMMAASGLSEEELGEGAGTGSFAGALMTSGSFTMMAASGLSE